MFVFFGRRRDCLKVLFFVLQAIGCGHVPSTSPSGGHDGDRGHFALDFKNEMATSDVRVSGHCDQNTDR